MNLFSKETTKQADFKDIRLTDVVERLKHEDFFRNDGAFYIIKVINENHVIFGVPKDKITPTEIHDCQYFSEEKKFSIKSRYRNMFFPALFFYFLPLSAICLNFREIDKEGFMVLLWLMIGITAFILMFAIGSIRSDAKVIERAINIRVNYLLRKKGYKIGL